jgi:hypothetical protein
MQGFSVPDVFDGAGNDWWQWGQDDLSSAMVPWPDLLDKTNIM